LKPLLFDEGLSPAVAQALATLRLSAHAIGQPGAPPKQSTDEANCKWCKENAAVLVTNDRGKKDRVILDLLAQHHIHAIFIHNDLRSGPPHRLARAILQAEARIDELAGGRVPIRHRLRPNGGLAKR
jgi:peptidoglycan/xylan/chitin deacetylase (PgdA/CDA1 family)